MVFKEISIKLNTFYYKFINTSAINEYRLYSITQEYINNKHKILGIPPICLHIQSLLGMPIDYEGLRIKRIKFDDKQEDLKNLFFKNQEIFCKKCENKNKSICSNMFQKTYVDNKHKYKYAPEDVIYFIREDLLGKYPEENKRT